MPRIGTSTGWSRKKVTKTGSQKSIFRGPVATGALRVRQSMVRDGRKDSYRRLRQRQTATTLAVQVQVPFHVLGSGSEEASEPKVVTAKMVSLPKS